MATQFNRIKNDRYVDKYIYYIYSPMSTPTALAKTLASNLQQIRSQLARLDAQAIARQSGFLQRSPRKVPVVDFLLALVALAAEA